MALLSDRLSINQNDGMEGIKEIDESDWNRLIPDSSFSSHLRAHSLTGESCERRCERVGA
jgi:hypothetical protein